MDQENSILVGPSLREYFRELVGRARSDQGLQLGEGAEAYLVNLLTEFTWSERLFVPTEDGKKDEEPLAWMLIRALEAPPAERIQELRRLGDTSLWVAGLFEDHVDRRALSPAYYRSMGHHAYAQLAAALGARRRQRALAELYDELAQNFDRMVDLLNEISERVALSTQQGLLRLYERFRRTGSLRAGRLLASQGLLPALGGRGGLAKA